MQPRHAATSYVDHHETSPAAWISDQLAAFGAGGESAGVVLR